MNGSIRKKGENWYYTLELGQVNGKRKRRERYAGKTKREAQKTLNRVLLEYEKKGELYEPSKLLVSEFLDQWIEMYVMIALKPNTQVSYKYTVEKYIKPKIGDIPLAALSPYDIQKFVNDYMQDGYSPKSLQQFHGILKSAMNTAVHPLRYLRESPVKNISLPRVTRLPGKEKCQVVTKEQYKKIVAFYPEDHYYNAMIQLAFHTGLRAGEVCGLTWEKINFNDQTLTVDQAVSNSTTELILGTPKTVSSIRTIAISKYVIQLLKRRKKIQLENRLKYGMFYEESDFVFTLENGRYLMPRNLNSMSTKIRNALCFQFNFHMLRHTHASMLLASGANYKAIQQRLGHKLLSTTMDTYGHITQELEEQTKMYLERLASEN